MSDATGRKGGSVVGWMDVKGLWQLKTRRQIAAFCLANGEAEMPEWLELWSQSEASVRPD